MSRNREFDQIFLRGSFDNGLVDGTAFAAQAAEQQHLATAEGSKDREKASSGATQRQLHELRELQARQSEQRAHLVVLGQPPRAEALQGYQCVDLADTQVIDTDDQQQAARQLCFSRDGLNRSAPGSRATSTTVYQNGKQVMRLNSGGMMSEKMGGPAGQRLPRQSHQTSLNQTQTNSHSQVISPHFYRQRMQHGPEDQLDSRGPGFGSADIGPPSPDARASAEMRQTKLDHNLDLKAVHQNQESIVQNLQNQISQTQSGTNVHRVKRGPPVPAKGGALTSGRPQDLANTDPDELTQKQMLSELLLAQQLQKGEVSMRNEGLIQVEQSKLRNTSVHSAAKSAAPNEAPQYLDQLSSVSGKVASAHLGGGPVILENDDQLGAHQRRARKQKTANSIHDSKSKESKVDSKSQTHSQIMKMMKTMEEFGRQAQLANGDSAHQAVLPNEVLLAQVSPAHSKDSEWAPFVHVMPARSEDGIVLGSPHKYPSTRRTRFPISVRADDNDYMPKRPHDIVLSHVAAEKRAIQICNCLIGLAMDQTIPSKASFFYPNGPLGIWSTRFASVSSKNTGRTAPFPRPDARSDARKYNTGVTEIKSNSSHVSGCIGCREIQQNRQQRNQEAVLQQTRSLQKHICKASPQSTSLLNLFKDHSDELIMSRGFQQLQGFLLDPYQLSPRSREKKEMRLCRKIEETIGLLQTQQPADDKQTEGLTDEELLASILYHFETLGEQRIFIDRKQRRAEREKQHKYKIVKGQIFEAVAVKEHQFKRASNERQSNVTFVGHAGSKATPQGDQLTDQQDSARGSLTSRNRSQSRSKSRTRSKSPAAGQIPSPRQRQDYCSNPQQNESNRIHGVGFGCDITYKDKDKIVYRFSTKTGQAEIAAGLSRQPQGNATAAGFGTLQTIEDTRKASTKLQATYSPMHGNKTREGQESAFRETHISSTLHHTINESGQSPMKTPKLQHNAQINPERSREGPSLTLQEQDQCLIQTGWQQSKRPLTSKMRAQQVFSKRVESRNQSEVRPQSSGTGLPREAPTRSIPKRGFGAIGGNQRTMRPSIGTDAVDQGRLLQVTSNNPYSISAHDKTLKPYRVDGQARVPGQLSAAQTNQTEFSHYNSTKRGDHQRIRTAKSNVTSSKGKPVTSRHARMQLTQGAKPALPEPKKPVELKKEGPAQFVEAAGRSGRQTAKDMQIMSAIGMMGGFAGLVSSKQMSSTTGLANLASQSRNPFQLALGVTGKQAGRLSSNQGQQGRLKTANAGQNLAGPQPEKIRGSLRLDHLGNLKKDEDEVPGDYSRDYEEVTEVTGPAGGDRSAPIRFRDELEAPENGISMQQTDTLPRGAHSRRRLLSKQGLAAGGAGMSQPQFGAPSEQELNPQFRVEFRKSNQRFNPNNDRRWIAGGHEPLGRARASSSGRRGYESALQDGSSEVAQNNLGAGSVAASLPGNPRLISSEGVDLRGGAASQYGERRRGYEVNTGEARQSRVDPRATEDIEVDTKEDPEEAQHTITKNMKSSSARQTNESPYRVESKSSLRRQISLTKNLRKGLDRKRGANSNEDPDELELMNDDDFVRAPLNLNMEITGDAMIDKENVYQLQRKALSGVRPSKTGAAKKRAKNATDLATGSQLPKWQSRDGQKQPLSQPTEPSNVDRCSPNAREQARMTESPAKHQILSPLPNPPQQQDNTRSTEKVVHTQDPNTDSLLQSPPLLDAKKERERLMEIQSPSPPKNQMVSIPPIISGSCAQQDDDAASAVPMTAEWSPLKAGGANTLERTGGRRTIPDAPDNDGSVTMAGGASAGTFTLTKHTDPNGTQVQTLGALRGSTGQASHGNTKYQRDDFEHKIDTGGQIVRGAESFRGGGDGDEDDGKLEQAHMVKNIVLFSKSPNQQMGQLKEADQVPEPGGATVEKRPSYGDKSSKRPKGAQGRPFKEQKPPTEQQPDQVKPKPPSRPEKTRLLDLIKPNSAIVTSKHGNVQRGLSSQRPRPLAITSASSAAERLAKSGAVGHTNPIPGWRLSEAGRLLKSYRTNDRSRQHNMAKSVRQGRLPQYEEGKTVASSFQSRERAARDKTTGEQRGPDAGREEINNQKAFLFGDQSSISKDYQMDQGTQLDLARIDQDAYAGFYEQPYAMVVADGVGGFRSQLVGGMQREAEEQNVRPTSQTYLEQDTQILRDQGKGEHGVTGGDVLSPKSDIRLVTQERETSSKPELQAYHIQSVAFPLPGQSAQDKPLASRPGDRVSEQQPYDPPSTQYIDYSAKNGGATYAEALQGQATSYQMSDQQLGATSLPGSNPLNRSLPRSLRGDMVLLQSQQLQSTLSKNQKASTLVLPESQLGVKTGPEGQSRVEDANFGGPGVADSRDNTFTGRDNHSSMRNQHQFFNQHFAPSSNGLQQYVTTVYHQGNKWQQLASSQQPLDQQRESQVTEEQKEEIEQMILSHIMQSITSQENIQVILNSKNSNQLIYAKDADFMNQAVFNKFAQTWAQREGVRTNADDVLRECRDKIHRLYLEVASYFGAKAPPQGLSNPGTTFQPGQNQFHPSPTVPRGPASSQVPHRFRDLLSSNSRELITENGLYSMPPAQNRPSKNVKFVFRGAPLAGGKDGAQQQRTSSQQSAGAGAPQRRQTSGAAGGKHPDFNVQIKYKNSENEVNQFRELAMSGAGRRNSFRIETAKPLSPQGRDGFLADSQQFPKRLRTPVYADSMQRGRRRQAQLGAKANARRQKRVSEGASSSQVTHIRGPSSTANAMHQQPIGRPSPTFKSGQFQTSSSGGGQPALSGQHVLGGGFGEPREGLYGGTMAANIGGTLSLLESQPLTQTQESAAQGVADDAIKFVVVGGGVPRNFPIRTSASKSLAPRQCESATNRLQASDGPTGQFAKASQNQFASHTSFAVGGGQLATKRGGGSQRYAGVGAPSSSKQTQNQSIPTNDAAAMQPIGTLQSTKQEQ